MLLDMVTSKKMDDIEKFVEVKYYDATSALEP